MNDFCYVTGRKRIQVEEFLSASPKSSWTPTMGDVVIVELIARNEATGDLIFEIAGEYVEGGKN